MRLLSKAGGLVGKVTGSLFGGNEVNEGYDKANKVQWDMYNTARGDLAPYRDYGQNYMAKMNQFMQSPRNRPVKPTAESITQTPGYKFRLDEGTRTLDNSAIAKGGLLSGNHLKAIMGYGQDYASNEYDKAQNQYAQDVQLDEGLYQNEFARLMQNLNIGYGAAGGSAGVAQNTGNALAGLAVNQGNAQAEIKQFPWKMGAAAYGAKG